MHYNLSKTLSRCFVPRIFWEMALSTPTTIPTLWKTKMWEIIHIGDRVLVDCYTLTWCLEILGMFEYPMIVTKQGCCLCSLYLHVKKHHPGPTTSHTTFVAPWYSTSVNEKATTCYFFLVHVTVPMPMLKTYPKVDLLSSTKPTQSKSVHPHGLEFLLLLYKIPKSSVLFT